MLALVMALALVPSFLSLASVLLVLVQALVLEWAREPELLSWPCILLAFYPSQLSSALTLTSFSPTLTSFCLRPLS